MSRLWLLPVLAVLLIAFGPSASAAPPLPAPAPPVTALTAQTLTVRVGALRVAANAPLHLARERGYLREEGLDAEVTAFDSGQQMIAPLGADQLDAGLGAVGPGLSNALLRGINLRIVADAVRAASGAPRYNCLLVRQELLDSGAVRTVADLRGRVYAENVPRNINTYAFERDLRQAGVQPDDVRYVTIPFPDMLAAFANGLIDAAHMTEPFVTQAEERGVSRCWRPLSETAPDMQLAVLLYGPAFAEQRPEAARGFMVAYLRGIRDYHRAFFGDGQGRAEVLELLTRITPIRDLALLERIAPPWMDPNGGVNVASLSAIQRWYLERGDLTQEVDMARVVDPTFVDYALGRLGRY